jgi:hypothetical protein
MSYTIKDHCRAGKNIGTNTQTELLKGDTTS